MGITEELLAAYGDAEQTAKVRSKIEAVAEDFKAQVRAGIAAVVKVMDEADLDLLTEAIERRRAVLRDPAEEARRASAYRRAAMELARDSVSVDDPLNTEILVFYGIEAESRVTGETPYSVAAGDPVAEEALNEVARRGIRTHQMRHWLHLNWGLVSDRAATILAVEGIGRA